jgi:Cdc6-like AAA superfamily ATPase/predicted RNA-binding protein with PUA-like domain
LITLHDVGIRGMVDKDQNGKNLPLEEIDPFTFFCYIYKHGVANQLKYLRKISEHFGIDPLPEDQNGIPSAQGLSVKLFPHKADRNSREIERLWSFFKAGMEMRITNEQFADILTINGTGKAKITEVLFYVDPEHYLPLDGQTIPYLKKVLNINPDFNTWDDYQAIITNVRDKTSEPFYKISYDAWYWNSHQTINYWVFQGNPKFFDVVSALKENGLRSWMVKSYKGQIKKGDKVILWISGELSGCYALCTVDSDVQIMDEGQNERRYYRDPESIQKTERVNLKIDHNLNDKPILKGQLLETEPFKNFAGENQGTNLKATKQQYETILNMIAQKPEILYWLYAPGRNAMFWDEFFQQNIMCVGDDNLGNLLDYQSKEEISNRLKELANTDREKWNDALTLFNFSRVIKPGDIVIAKRGRSEYLGYGVIASDYYFDKTREVYKQSRRVEWKSKIIHPAPQKNIVVKSMTEITPYPDYVNRLKKLYNISEPEPFTPLPPKNQYQFPAPLNLILYGPPGTGKTYHTINEALKIIIPDFDLNQEREIVRKEFDKFVKEGRIVFTTFHQSMSYEDFVEGIKPVDPGMDESQVIYRTQPGIFKQLCQRASERSIVNNFDDAYQQFINDLTESGGITLKTPAHQKEFRVTVSSRGSCIAKPSTDQATSMTIPADSIRKVVETGIVKDWSSYAIPIGQYLKQKYNLTAQSVDNASKPFILIIDEINRGNVSQIFGELITLIEPDKRAGANEALEATLPYSKEIFSVPSNLFIIGTMNTADRSVEAIDTALRRRFIFKEMMPDYDAPGMDTMIEGIPLNGLLSVINQRIEVLLDRDHQIGHSFLMHVGDMTGLMNAFYNNIIPLLKEYFYGDFGKIGLVLESGFVVEEKDRRKVFSDFPYEDKSLLSEKKIYRIYDFRENGGVAAFSRALKLLLGQPAKEAENES